ncbi:hypothetical protein BV25DRAFT_1288617 [Artomyces pyxidatus]|uniref:Uncharacterized protein n=1 Tax=Artomyces pyxidatus TaxID=48021 RepID=A0ACB8SQZ4_9AGAM|nr:hypothetical protein BV25DRAFT_1288617 [Artomyces pyxidatus]
MLCHLSDHPIPIPDPALRMFLNSHFFSALSFYFIFLHPHAPHQTGRNISMHAIALSIVSTPTVFASEPAKLPPRTNPPSARLHNCAQRHSPSCAPSRRHRCDDLFNASRTHAPARGIPFRINAPSGPPADNSGVIRSCIMLRSLQLAAAMQTWSGPTRFSPRAADRAN